MEKIPNRIIQCCRHQAFLWENYPTQISSIAGARRYMDVMQEGRLSQTFDEILDGGVTDGEMQILEKVARRVQEFSSEFYGKAASPKDSLARSINIYRHIRLLVPEPPATVFEVGGGLRLRRCTPTSGWLHLYFNRCDAGFLSSTKSSFECGGPGPSDRTCP